MKPGRKPDAADAQWSSTTAAARGALALSILLALCGAASAQARPAEQREEAGPPPLKYIPEVVRRRLAAAKDMKDRTKLSLALADERLAAAAAHVDAERFEASTAELGVYEAVVNDAIRFVQRSGPTTNKQRDLLKRIEMSLRAHATRLETIRRGLPAQNGVHVQAALDFVRDARAAALDSFFDNTVFRDAPPVVGPAEGARAGGATSAASAKEVKPQPR